PFEHNPAPRAKSRRRQGGPYREYRQPFHVKRTRPRHRALRTPLALGPGPSPEGRGESAEGPAWERNGGENTRGRRRTAPHSRATATTQRLPLPLGEGRGEGNRRASIPVPSSTTRHLALHRDDANGDCLASAASRFT